MAFGGDDFFTHDFMEALSFQLHSMIPASLKDPQLQYQMVVLPLLTELKHGRKAANQSNHGNDRVHGKENQRDKRSSNSAQWIPHLRTGIYYPKGHESVMETVPKGAASFGTTYWLRNHEGTEHGFADHGAAAVFDHPFVN